MTRCCGIVPATKLIDIRFGEADRAQAVRHAGATHDVDQFVGEHVTGVFGSRARDVGSQQPGGFQMPRRIGLLP